MQHNDLKGVQKREWSLAAGRHAAHPGVKEASKRMNLKALPAQPPGVSHPGREAYVSPGTELKTISVHLRESIKCLESYH